jgi:hypothetical protein
MVKKDPGRSGPVDNPETDGRNAGRTSIRLVWLLSVALLVSSGGVYRLLAHEHEHFMDNPITLPVPLTQFPQTLFGWTGEVLPIPATTEEYMRKNFADDYFSRRYVNKGTGQYADLYVVYCSSEPGGILGHQPLVCYPSAGWTWDQTTPSQIATRSGCKINCLIHRFHKRGPPYKETVVVNFYVLNGRISVREKDFSGFWARRPNIAGNRARYVAQVQAASEMESSAVALARDTTDMILSFLPDADGKTGMEAGVGQPENESQ